VTRRLAAAEAQAGPTEDRRARRRAPVQVPGRLCLGDLILPGTIENVGAGGVFFRTCVLVEPGERGRLCVGADTMDVSICVIWCRTAVHPRGPGLGLAWATEGDPGRERAALEAILALLADPH